MKKSKKKQYPTQFCMNDIYYRIEYGDDYTINLYREADNELLRSTQLKSDQSAVVYCMNWVAQHRGTTISVTDQKGVSREIKI